MKKNKFLGVQGDVCCILESLLNFDQLDVNTLQPSDFIHSSTNWGGCDKIKRTVEIRKFETTGREKVLNKPLLFMGKDYDCGKDYSWQLQVDKIVEIK